MSSIITTGIVLRFFSDVHALHFCLFILRSPVLLYSVFGFEKAQNIKPVLPGETCFKTYQIKRKTSSESRVI